jgi:two-component system, chemotaxis family, chemotaxis protein CheY
MRIACLQCRRRIGRLRPQKEFMEMDTAASKEDAGTSADGKKLRVLVVDDQPAVCEVVADTIAYAGHEIVGKGRDGMEAVSLAKELSPDLVVMDISMPRMNGVDAMKAILAAKSAKRVLLMSGEYRSLGVTREEMMREGAAGFMEKPFNVSDLFELLDRWSGEEQRK